MNDKLPHIPHILNTSANLLGICFFIITGIHLADKGENMEITRMVVIVSFMLLTSCFLSYLSMRSKRKALLYEKYADYFFLASIGLLFVTMAMLALDIGVV